MISIALAVVVTACTAVEVLGPLDGESSDSDADSDSDGDSDTDSDGDTDTFYDCDEMPPEACNIDMGVGETCSGPATIGRAIVPVGANILDKSLTGAIDDDQICDGLGPDQFYRLYIKAGETLNLSVTTDTPGTFDPVLALFKTPDPCVGSGCPAAVVCDENTDGGDTASIDGWTSTTSGWHVIKIDAREALTGSGEYDVFVSLDCLSVFDCDC
ncbi:MAG: hypothetical protein JRF63_13465 [Deltaproteobacteria bacterium]|nr:hypothetical protein [Deltaproteobacteria bacterium]